MDTAKYRFFMGNTDDNPPTTVNNLLSTESDICIADQRVARLLLILEDLDRSVAGLEEVPQEELSDLISNAILACGFVNPVEAKYAIAAVLQAIEDRGLPACSRVQQ